MDKSQLIATILSEVKDPALRERLLRQVAEEEKTSDHSPSIVLSELQSWASTRMPRSRLRDFISRRASSWGIWSAGCSLSAARSSRLPSYSAVIPLPPCSQDFSPPWAPIPWHRPANCHV